MKALSLSINPLYRCNFRCDFCYLTPEQLSSRDTMDLSVLDQRLKEVTEQYRLKHVDIYGGELHLLNDMYLESLLERVFNHNPRSVNLVTNLSQIHPSFRSEDVTLSVSYDFSARPQEEVVLNNIAALTRPYSVLTLVTQKVLETPLELIIGTYNSFGLMDAVEFKPYSPNQANQHGVSDYDYALFVQAVIEHPDRRFTVSNEKQIKKALLNFANPFSDDHVYITPKGQFAVLEFDGNDNEFFLEMSSLEEYRQWTVKEHERVLQNGFCKKCPYLGSCLSEHLRNVKKEPSLYSCNGHYRLLSHFEGKQHDDVGQD